MKVRLDKIDFERKFLSKKYNSNLHQSDQLKKVNQHQFIMNTGFISLQPYSHFGRLCCTNYPWVRTYRGSHKSVAVLNKDITGNIWLTNRI